MKVIIKSGIYMDKIVNSGLKIDLHIHSFASVNKDGKKVKYNTLHNLPSNFALYLNKLAPRFLTTLLNGICGKETGFPPSWDPLT